MGMILIADDEPIIARVLASPLRERGFDVITAEDGLEALISCQRRQPNILISDVSMPGLDGYGLVRAVNASYPETMCILMSGGTDFDDARVRTSTSDLRLFATFKKPFSLAEFFTTIERAMHEPGARTG